MFDLNEFQMNAIAGGLVIAGNSGGRMVTHYTMNEDGTVDETEEWESDGGGDYSGSPDPDPDPSPDPIEKKSSAQEKADIAKTKAETDKIRAETEKIRAETTLILKPPVICVDTSITIVDQPAYMTWSPKIISFGITGVQMEYVPAVTHTESKRICTGPK